MRTQSLALAFILGISALNPAHAQNAPAPRPAAGQPDLSKLTEQQIKQIGSAAAVSKLAESFNAHGDIQRLTWALERMVELLPNSGDLKYQLAIAYAQQDEKSKAYDLLVHMQAQGFGYDVSKDKRLEKLHDTKVWDYIVANLQANSKSFGEGKVAFDLPVQDALFESISYDPKRKQFLFGSAREGKIYLSDNDGKLSEFIAPDEQNGLWGVYDIAVDGKQDLLYVASSGTVHFKGFKQEAFGKAGIFKFQLSSGKFLARYLAPEDGHPHIFSSMVVGKDGQVLAADGVRNEIYKLETAGLKLLVRNPKLTSIRGLALSDDGKTLYFADYALGLFGVDLTKSSGFDLQYNPEKLVLGGIDGLYYFDGHLVVIENGMVPQRVMRLKLSADGHSIAGAMPLDVAQPSFALPTIGTIVGNNLYFIANSQKGLYDQYGVLKDASKLQPVHVFKSDLRFAWGQAGVGSDLAPIPAASKKQFDNLTKPAKEPEKTNERTDDGK